LLHSTIFNSFKTPLQHQYKVLLWGIVGAIVLRAGFIVVGVLVVERFAWVMVLFGAFLIYTGLKLLKDDDDPAVDTAEALRSNVVIRALRHFVPITSHYDRQGRFFVPIGEVRFAPPPVVRPKWGRR
jgi:tellurite resistance protein TerC